MSTPTTHRAADYSLIDIELIRPGTVLFAPILDDRDVLILAEGQTVTESFLQKLRERRIKTVRVHDRDAIGVDPDGPRPEEIGKPAGSATEAPGYRNGVIVDCRNEGSNRLDAEVALGRTDLPPQGEPLLGSLNFRKGPYDSALREKMVEAYGVSARRMRRAYEGLAAGRGIDRETMDEIASDAVSALTGDPDLFVGIAANVGGGGYPSRHSVHVAHVALSIGTRLGLDSPTVRELVLGGLIHDAGMLRINPAVLESPQPLNRSAYLEITKHPVYVFDLVRDMGSMPKRSAFIAYQVHERCDGSGYPRRRSGPQIHFLSKVAAVADTYVALVSQRPHRPAMMPYYAMERVVRDAGNGLFDRDAARAILRTLSLFPIGSYVALSDGRSGRVLRASDEYTRPTVEVFGPSDSKAEVVDLVARRDLSVVRPLPAL